MRPWSRAPSSARASRAPRDGAAIARFGVDIVSDPASGSGQYGFAGEQVVTLTYPSAEALLASNPTGRGNGVLAIGYVDNPRFAGDYTVYLKLERVPCRAPRRAGAGRAPLVIDCVRLRNR